MTCGEGGIITTNDDEFMELCKRFRHHGQSEKTNYEYYDLGYNYRMTDLQASIALVQLKKLNSFTDARIKNAMAYKVKLEPLNKYVTVPHLVDGCKHVFHRYTIKVKDNIALKKYLFKHDIMCGIYYPKPLHLHKHFQRYGYEKGDFPISEKLSKHVLSLPVHPGVTIRDVHKVCECIEAFYK